MIAIAVSRRAAVILTEEEKYYLTDIARSSSDAAASKRAKILIAFGEGKTYEWIIKFIDVSTSVTTAVKKQWNNSKLSGCEKVDAVCFAKAGRRRNKKVMVEKINNILKFNNQISPEISQNARSLQIVEMAEKEGMQISQSTVIRFLRDYRRELNL